MQVAARPAPRCSNRASSSPVLHGGRVGVSTSGTSVSHASGHSRGTRKGSTPGDRPPTKVAGNEAVFFVSPGFGEDHDHGTAPSFTADPHGLQVGDHVPPLAASMSLPSAAVPDVGLAALPKPLAEVLHSMQGQLEMVARTVQLLEMRLAMTEQQVMEMRRQVQEVPGGLNQGVSCTEHTQHAEATRMGFMPRGFSPQSTSQHE